MTLCPLLHRSMSLETRCEVGLSGYLALDLFQMLAAETTERMRLPRGSGFMASQTSSNLMSCALSGVALCLTKDPSFQPWCNGHLRLSEIPIEQWFLFLRSQSPNSQLSARSFWQADARMMLRVGKELNKEKAIPLCDEPPLSEDQCLGCVLGLAQVKRCLPLWLKSKGCWFSSQVGPLFAGVDPGLNNFIAF